ncbi:twitching motility protein PilT [Candidatus Gracilibacteria bacterium]|nr:twitching motility protein PilT [Candidatus Gracilibacteria bacterium]
MNVSLNFLVRIAGMICLAWFGRYVGRALSSPAATELQLLATELLMLAGAGLGLLVTPRLTIDPLRELLRRSRGVPLADILLIAVGGLIGLIFAVLLTVPLSSLPRPFSQLFPIGAALLLSYIGAAVFAFRKRDLIDILRLWRTTSAPHAVLEEPSPARPRQFILDTSAIIDGRIAAVVRTGFLDGTLIAPSFVLAELQALADSSDELKRAKGRRGLELLNEMQKNSPLPVQVLNVDIGGVARVDDKLVALARECACPIITNDFNLNKVAGLQGVKVLSLNQLTEAVRPPVNQDQRLSVIIRDEGKARQQGVGYLEDGTPVIVENARQLIGQQVDIVVTRLHQTQTGRLVFATLDSEGVAASHTEKEVVGCARSFSGCRRPVWQSTAPLSALSKPVCWS